MSTKEEIKEKAKIFRECADLLDEMAEVEDTEKGEELMVKLMIRMMKLDLLK